MMAGPVYALNLFNIADRDEYLAYSRRSPKEVQAHGGRVVALGKFREAVAGEIKPRTVMMAPSLSQSNWTTLRCIEPGCALCPVMNSHIPQRLVSR
jgi:uncharacterized protein (DUF1330 family)